MAQQRFFNWKENDSTFLLAQRLAGYFLPGRYAGFDFSPTANMTLTLPHTTSGMDVRGYTGSPVKNGVVHTNQGVTVFEDAAVTLPIGAVGGLPRIDLVILTHSQTQNPGGALALYSVVQGTPGASPVKPAIPTPDTQLEIGSLYLPASVTALNQPGVVWVQSKVSALETKANNTDTENLYLLNSYVSDALGKALSLQSNKDPRAYDLPIPPILIYGGYADADPAYIVAGYMYYDSELMRINPFAVTPGTGSFIVCDVVGVSPFKSINIRFSTSNDGDFLYNDSRFLYDFIVEKTAGVWQNIILANGWQTNALGGETYYPAQYKIQEGNIFFRGTIAWDITSPPSSFVFMTSFGFSFLKGTKQPAARVNIGEVFPSETWYLISSDTGQLSAEVTETPITNQVFSLDGCVISLD